MPAEKAGIFQYFFEKRLDNFGSVLYNGKAV